jgi:hypothetical protein
MTHEFTPDWKLSQQDQLQVHLSIALAKHIPGWPGATDEQLAAVAGDLVSGTEDYRGRIESALDFARQDADKVCISTIGKVQEQLAAVSKRAAAIRSRETANG